MIFTFSVKQQLSLEDPMICKRLHVSSAGSVAAHILDISKCWPSDCISILSLLFVCLNFALPVLHSEVLYQSSFFELTFVSYETICKFYATCEQTKSTLHREICSENFQQYTQGKHKFSAPVFSKAEQGKQQVCFLCLPHSGLYYESGRARAR